MKIISILFLVLAGAFSYNVSTCYGQSNDSLILSLEQCIALADQNNQNLANKRQDELIEYKKIQETKSDLIPQITGKGNYLYYFDVPKVLVPGESFGGPQGTYSEATFLVPQNISGSIDLSLQVYNPAILASLKLNKASQELSTLSTKDKLESLIYDISATYLNIQINELQIGLTKSNIANLKKSLELTTNLYRQGLALGSDVKNLELSVFNLKTVLNNQMLGQNQLYRLLKVFMGLSPDKIVKIAPYVTGASTYGLIIENDTSVYLKRTGYLTVQQSGSLIQAERKIITSGFVPSLMLIGSLGYAGYNPEYDFMKNYNDKWYPTNLIQVTLSVPIFDGLKKTRQLAQNKIKSVQNTNTLEYLKNTYRMEQLNAIDNYNHNMKSLDFQNQNLTQADILYKQKLLEYKSGLASLNDLISVDNTLKAAQVNYINAIISTELAALDLKKVNGLLISK